jgi:hypothetical protein
MMKHIGKHNSQRVVILFRKVPNEDHMCLLVYSELLPRLYHDEVMKALESPIGQNAKEFSDVLFRTTMADGQNCLEALHRAGLIKKVPTSQVLITPTNSSSVRLDELNSILDEMSKGEEAIAKLAEIDADRGMTGKKKRPAELKEVGQPPNSRARAQVEGTMSAGEFVSTADVLDDSALATQRLAQATKMKAEAHSLLAEAARLEQEAAQLIPTPVTNVKSKATKKTAAKKQTA